MNLAAIDWVSLAWSQLWQVTALAVVVGVLTRLLCRHRPHLAYVLWMLVVVKCLTPPIWSSPTGLFSWARVDVVAPETMVRRRHHVSKTAKPTSYESFEPTPLLHPRKTELTGVTSVASDNVVKGATGSSPASVPHARADKPPVAPRVWLRTVLLCVWLCGMGVFGAVVVWRWFRLHRTLVAAAAAPDASLAALADGLAKRLGLRRPVRVLLTSEPIGPAVFGILRPKVLLPAALVQPGATGGLSARETAGPGSQAARATPAIEPILAHELVHVRRWDTAAGALQVLVQVAWWFHPLIWWANRQAVRERERACDEEVVAGLACKPSAYAQSLLDVLELKRRLQPILGLPGLRPMEVTSRRLERIMKRAKTFHRRTPAWCWLVLAAGLLLIAPGAGLQIAASEAEGEKEVTAPLATEEPAPNAEKKEKPAARDSESLHFGPVIERTINDDHPEAGNFLIDLDTGKFHSLPERFVHTNEDFGEVVAWMAEVGVDAMGEISSGFQGLVGMDMIVIPGGKHQWDLPPSHLQRQLALGDPGRPAAMSASGSLPVTFLFQTREGGQGVLQISERKNEGKSRSVKVRYKLLVEGKQAAANTAEQDDTDTGFGDVFERTVNDDNPEIGNFLIELDTGKVLSPPKELEGEDALFAWVEENGIDATGEIKSGFKGLMGFDMIAIPLTSDHWDPSPDFIQKQLALGRPGTPALISGSGDLPATYQFKTREGGIGVLQIVGFSDDPQAVKIRYKLLEEQSKKAPQHGALERIQGDAFGEVIRRTVNHDDPELGNFLIDLDTGKLFSPPKDLKDADQDRQAARAWMAEHGIDAMGEGAGQVRGLRWFDTVVMPIELIPSDKRRQVTWEHITPDLLGGLDYVQASPPVTMTERNKLPATYFFKTREGGRGILQIVGFSEDPAGVKIRYKLLVASNQEAEKVRPSGGQDVGQE